MKRLKRFHLPRYGVLDVGGGRYSYLESTESPGWDNIQHTVDIIRLDKVPEMVIYAKSHRQPGLECSAVF